MAKLKHSRKQHQQQADAIGEHLKEAGQGFIKELLEVHEKKEEPFLPFINEDVEEAIKQIKKKKDWVKYNKYTRFYLRS